MLAMDGGRPRARSTPTRLRRPGGGGSLTLEGVLAAQLAPDGASRIHDLSLEPVAVGQYHELEVDLALWRWRRHPVWCRNTIGNKSS